MSKADELIACLEGEIAKRDARIVELESRYQRDVLGLNNEGDPIGGDPAGGYANDNARLRAELAVIKAQEPVGYRSGAMYSASLMASLNISPGGLTPLYAAPVPEAKAQGVVMPERWNVPRPMWKDARQPYGNPLNHADIEAAEKFNLALDEVARLNATPVHQVSVPDGWKLVPVEPTKAMLFACEDAGSIHNQQRGKRIYEAMLYAAPAAPAADANHVFYGMDGNHP